MLKVIGIIALVLVVVVAGLLIFAATKPDSFRIERTASIKAPPEKIFALINDLHQWTRWSPYEKIDPALKRTYGGAEAGKGATYEWSGNKNVGSGRMEILDTQVPSRILIKLDFMTPFEGHHTAEFTLVPTGETTSVTWAMYGTHPFLGKVIGIFFNMDKMVGGQFEEGLANLKAAVE
ncbi:polyketide cyclase [Oleomonas cavernae]|uniref:Polyketide cyclase n=1 Tax=Oleomonas cavernae TaxID=2320859 RepID=A0A418WCR2_9PROT|nr:SRPBCC family protein [Oleomonas cavernae]RJF87821.1 polyketide cyclase [Oleomonas cavernae]RJF96423.1 polyketide cyclase [Oleomonas cavernae]